MLTTRTLSLLLFSATIGIVLASAEPPYELAASLLEEQGLPGLVVASVAVSPDDGQLLSWTAAFGHANVELGINMTTDTSLWLASLTKVFTGTAMIKAKEQGHLSLDDKAVDILADGNSFTLPDNLNDLTLEDLATHRSTIVDNQAVYLCGYYVGSVDNHTLLLDVFGQNFACVSNSPVALDEFLPAYLSPGQAYYSTENFLNDTVPGEVELYSNFGAALAGHLIGLSVTSDAPNGLPEYTTTQLFEQLGMANTSFLSSDLSSIATPYSRFAGAVPDYMAIPIYDIATYPDGGLRSSANDMAKFMGAIMNQGTLVQTETTATGESSRTEVTILEPESVQEMVTPTEGFDRGLFWFVTTFPEFAGVPNRTLVGHNGGDAGAFSNMFLDLDSKTGFFIAGNGESDFVDPAALGELQQALMQYAQDMQKEEQLEPDGDMSLVEESEDPSETVSKSSEPETDETSQALKGSSDTVSSAATKAVGTYAIASTLVGMAASVASKLFGA